MSPTQIFRDCEFRLTIGTPGSDGILQTTLQMLLNRLEFGMTGQEAQDRYLRAPRYRVLTIQGFVEWIERVSVWGEARRHVRRVVPLG